MAAITGREVKVGLKKGSAWGSPVACATTDGILCTTFGLKQTVEGLYDDSLSFGFSQAVDKGKVEVTGTFEMYLRYAGMEGLMELILGEKVTQSGYNQFFPKNDNTGQYATLAVLKQNDVVWEYPSAKLHGFKLAADMNAPVKMTVDAIALPVNMAPTVNTAAVVTALAPVADDRIVLNTGASIKINGTEAAGKVNGFEFTFKRGMDAPHCMSASYAGISEPAANAMPECTMTLKFPRYEGDNYFSNWTSKSSLSIELGFVKGNRSYKLIIPKAVVDDAAADIAGVGLIPATLTLKCLADTMPGVTGPRPFRVEVDSVA